jgi:hypothetical protein
MLNYQTTTWGAAIETAADKMTVNIVNAIKHT